MTGGRGLRRCKAGRGVTAVWLWAGAKGLERGWCREVERFLHYALSCCQIGHENGGRGSAGEAGWGCGCPSALVQLTFLAAGYNFGLVTFC